MGNILPHKLIQIEKVNEVGNLISFKITKQTHRCGNFGTHGDSIMLNIGNHKIFKLLSQLYPEVGGHNTLYVRGEIDRRDNNIITESIEYYNDVLKACEEYNKMFSKKDIIINEDGTFEEVICHHI